MSKRRKFSREFKQGAVEQTYQPGATCAQVARELEIGANLLTRWRREAEASGGFLHHDRFLSNHTSITPLIAQNPLSSIGQHLTGTDCFVA